ncbi:MAG TPA: DUF2934 domain-containing protein [Actinomycetota bacterium]|nr:DUF2934 domain-containing protein [Actinomycetota bacterium]
MDEQTGRSGGEITDEQIRERAYEISQRQDAGTPEENWRRAEEELRGGTTEGAGSGSDAGIGGADVPGGGYGDVGGIGDTSGSGDAGIGGTGGDAGGEPSEDLPGEPRRPNERRAIAAVAPRRSTAPTVRRAWHPTASASVGCPGARSPLASWYRPREGAWTTSRRRN